MTGPTCTSEQLALPGPAHHTLPASCLAAFGPRQRPETLVTSRTVLLLLSDKVDCL